MQSRTVSLSSEQLKYHVPAPTVFLASRQQYHTCRIQIPDCDHSLPSIQTGRGFYSFLKATDTVAKTLRLLTKLSYRGEEVAILATPRGYSLWGLEPNATPIVCKTRTPAANLNAIAPGTCTILIDRAQYQPCYIRTPDLDKPLVAIAFNNGYYSFFRQEPEMDRALELITKIAQRGDDLIMVKSETDCILYIHEPGAQSIASGQSL